MGQRKDQAKYEKKRMKRQPNYRLYLIDRTEELIEYLMENNGHVELSKNEIAVVLAARYSKTWLTHGGKPNRQLVSDVCNLTRDQDDDPTARSRLGGYVVTYAPSQGGMTLVSPDGQMDLAHRLHMLAGDIQRQKSTETVLRRRIADWRAARKQAAMNGQHELAAVLSKIEDQIDRDGAVKASTVVEFEALLATMAAASA